MSPVKNSLLTGKTPKSIWDKDFGFYASF